MISPMVLRNGTGLLSTPVTFLLDVFIKTFNASPSLYLQNSLFFTLFFPSKLFTSTQHLCVFFHNELIQLLIPNITSLSMKFTDFLLFISPIPVILCSFSKVTDSFMFPYYNPNLLRIATSIFSLRTHSFTHSSSSTFFLSFHISQPKPPP